MRGIRTLSEQDLVLPEPLSWNTCHAQHKSEQGRGYRGHWSLLKHVCGFLHVVAKHIELVRSTCLFVCKRPAIQMPTYRPRTCAMPTGASPLSTWSKRGKDREHMPFGCCSNSCRSSWILLTRQENLTCLAMF